MRGYHDEMGGPESLASPSEWGDGPGWPDCEWPMTAGGLPASGTVPSPSGSVGGDATVRYPSESRQREMMSRGWLVPSAGTSPSDDELRHNHLLRRQIADPTFGVRDPQEWRRMAARGLSVDAVPVAPPVLVSRNLRERGRHLPT